MRRRYEILRFQEGVRSQHPTPEATVADRPPGVSPDAGDALAVLVDLVPQLPHRSRELRALAMETYWSSSGSVVARLRRALAAANRHLVRANAGTQPGAKCSGSLTCAAFIGEELFLGQIGAAYAFVRHPDQGWEAFPERDRLLIPLGGALPPVIHIGYTVLEEGTAILLATTPAAEVHTRARWLEALAQSTLADVSENVVAAMEQSQVGGSFILARALPKAEPPPEPRRSSRPRLFRRPKPPAQQVAPPDISSPPPSSPDVSQPSISPVASASSGISRPSKGGEGRDLFPPLPAEAQAAETAQPAPTPPVSRASQPAQPAPALPMTPLPAFLQRRLAQAQEQQPDAGAPEEPPALAKRPRARFQWSSVRDGLARIAKARRQRSQERRTTAQRARLRQALRSLLPGKVEGPRPKTRPAPPEKASLMGGLALGLTLLIAFITFSVYLRFGGAARAEELLVVAQSTRDKAFNTQETEDWRELLALSSRIMTLDPNNPQAEALRIEAEQAIDALESAAVLNAKPLLDLGTAPTPRRILVANAWIYILNTATDEVIGLPLNEDRVTASTDAPTPILKRGQTFYGEVVNHLVDLAWVEPGGSYPDGAVFIYSDGGTLFIYEPTLGPGSITRQHIQGNLEPGMVTLMETFGERVYLVQRQQNQVLTYEPVNGIYDTARNYFAEGRAPYLQEALDIGIDGRVYLLMGDGEILTYFTGAEDQSFSISGLPDPNLKPFVLAVERDPEVGLIYLGDALHDRIVVLDKSGAFMHQFRLPGEELQQLESLVVSEDPAVLYLIAANRLYAAPLPSFVASP